VKDHYSPKESWKGKPFAKEDARFFFRGIEELSDLFTQERPRTLPTYFTHPRFRSGYLLYFLPLQAAKFVTILQLHPLALKAALDHADKAGVLRAADLGAGPGTASLALLLSLLEQRERPTIPRIELEWVDTNRQILEEGKHLVEGLADHFPKLRGKVTVRTHVGSWTDASRLIAEKCSLVILGHVLNEAAQSVRTRDAQVGEPLSQRHTDELWNSLLALGEGGGTLIVEPAGRRPSQGLSRLRDALLESGVIEKSPGSIWGPCLHAERCPLAEGRDWCHFSVPAEVPGQWFREFSRGLGSERHWLKFSYLWLSSSTARAPVAAPDLRRVISDPLKEKRARDGGPPSVLLCEPGVPGRMRVWRTQTPYRGDLVRLSKGGGSGPRRGKRRPRRRRAQS
jgi:hypothetical protein